MAMTLVDSIAALAALRFITGIGLGGAIPNAAALSAEYVPVRQRPFAVTLDDSCAFRWAPRSPASLPFPCFRSSAGVHCFSLEGLPRWWWRLRSGGCFLNRRAF